MDNIIFVKLKDAEDDFYDQTYHLRQEDYNKLSSEIEKINQFEDTNKDIDLDAIPFIRKHFEEHITAYINGDTSFYNLLDWMFSKFDLGINEYTYTA